MGGRTVEPAVLYVASIVAEAIPEPVVRRGVAVAVVDQKSVVVDAILCARRDTATKASVAAKAATGAEARSLDAA